MPLAPSMGIYMLSLSSRIGRTTILRTLNGATQWVDLFAWFSTDGGAGTTMIGLRYCPFQEGQHPMKQHYITDLTKRTIFVPTSRNDNGIGSL